MSTAIASSAMSESVLASLGAVREKAASEGAMQDRFLKLLVTQLRNQDPLNPMDNAQMTSQLAQISTVDGIERLNQTLQALMTNADNTQALQAAQLVGREVLVPGGGVTLTREGALAGVELAEPADRVTALIRDGSGIDIRTLDLGPLDAGTHTFYWDGVADSGARAANGAYTVTLKAQRGDTAPSAAALTPAKVLGVSRSGAGVSLDLGALGPIQLADVKRIL